MMYPALPTDHDFLFEMVEGRAPLEDGFFSGRVFENSAKGWSAVEILAHWPTGGRDERRRSQAKIRVF